MAPKDNLIFICQNCGYKSLKWLGRCPDCQQWNTLIEEIERPSASSAALKARSPSYDAKPLPITAVQSRPEPRLTTHLAEFDRALGGGTLPGSVILIAGEPGIGKSTLLLQVARRLCETADSPALYVTGEESLEQIRLRADRLSALHDNLLIYPETNVELIEAEIKRISPCAIVIDSVQTLYCPEFTSAPGSITQIRETAARLLYLAKSLRIPLFFIGHVTKSGIVAGPRVLEHMVDTVLYFEGEQHHAYRILRATKNRFGPTNEVGVFEMTSDGLCELQNPSEVFLKERPLNSPGSVVTSSMEGTRPILVEIQSLTAYNGGFGAPRRSASGIDYRRLTLLLAVLEKHIGLKFYDQDVFLNVTGGIKIDEPAADLAIIVAVVSSFRNLPVDPDMIVLGEVGLAGEIRTIRHLDKRINEAARVGFSKCLLAETNLSRLNLPRSIKILTARRIREALDIVGLSL
jgi:DNA repair protein RadA/Sms